MRFVIDGAREHELPAAYVNLIEQIETKRDLDETRRTANLMIADNNQS